VEKSRSATRQCHRGRRINNDIIEETSGTDCHVKPCPAAPCFEIPPYYSNHKILFLVITIRVTIKPPPLPSPSINALPPLASSHSSHCRHRTSEYWSLSRAREIEPPHSPWPPTRCPRTLRRRTAATTPRRRCR
jgi:hypothetical protein